MNKSQRARAIAALARQPFEPLAMTVLADGYNMFRSADMVAAECDHCIDCAIGLL